MSRSLQSTEDAEVLSAPILPAEIPSRPRRLERARSGSGRMDRILPGLTLGPILIFLVVLPLILTFWSSLKPTGLIRDDGLTLSNYAEVYGDPDFPSLVIRTVLFAVGSAALTMVIAVPVTWLLERTDIAMKGVLRGLVVLALATPPTLLAISWVFLLHPRVGMINVAWRNLTGGDAPLFDIQSLGGMIFVQALALVPTTYLVLAPAFRNMDPSLEEAARTSGAGLSTVVFRIVLPVLRPAILSAFVLVIIIGFVVIDIPGILGLPVREFVLSSQLYTYINVSSSGLPRYGLVGALAATFVVVLLVIGLIYQRLTKDASRFVTVTGKGYRSAVVKLGRLRWVGLAFVWAFVALAIVLPMLALLWISFTPFQGPFSIDRLNLLTTKNFTDVLSSPLFTQAAVNSAIVAVVAAVAVTVLSTVISWVVVRSRAYGRRLIDLLAFLPVAIAGTIIGSALVTMYLNLPWLPVYGTIWIIVIAFVTVYISYGTRSINAVLAQIHADMEDAAHVSGAGWLRSFTHVTLPLILPAVLGVSVWVAAHSLREVSAPLLLRGRDNSMMATLLWDYWAQGRPSTAAAVGVILIAVLAVLVTLWQVLPAWISRRRARKSS